MLDKPTDAMIEAARELCDGAVDFYTARNGRRMSIEDSSGEKCWIVTSDALEQLRATLTPADDEEKTWAEREAEVMQHWRWGNLTKLGVANALMRAGFRHDVAVDKANALATLTPDPVQSDGEERFALRLAVDAFMERWDGQTRADTDYVAQLMKNAVNARLTSLSAPVEE